MADTVTPAPIEITTTDDEARPWLTIDGNKYHLAVSGDLGLSDELKLNRLIARFNRVTDGTAADLTDEEADQLEASFRWAPTVLLIDCPPEVLNKLKDGQRVAVLQAFSEAVKAVAAASAKTTKPRSKRVK